MADDALARLSGGPLKIELSAEPAWSLLADDDVLAVVQFGTPRDLRSPVPRDLRSPVEPRDLRSPIEEGDPRHVVTGLRIPGGGSAAEVWRVAGPVRVGNAEGLHYAAGQDYLLGQVEIGGDPAQLAVATQSAYVQTLRGCQALGYPHLLRLWNVVAGINDGDGDAERYRIFCQGRFNAFVAAARLPVYPAASAIGGDAATGMVYFLAGRAPAQLIENPHQISAFRYPRAYGPASPSFSRAALWRCGEELRLAVSGTASILGHQSRHAGDLAAQLTLTLDNLATVTAAAHAPAPLFRGDAQRVLLRTYVRHEADAPVVAALLAERVPAEVPRTVLRADICRRELMLEMEAMVVWPEAAP